MGHRNVKMAVFFLGKIQLAGAEAVREETFSGQAVLSHIGPGNDKAIILGCNVDVGLEQH
jgi:hypothetical protein